MIRLAIFDLDGTLLNTLDDLADAANFALQRHGLPAHPAQAYRRFVGNGVVKLVERMTPEALRGDGALLRALKADFDRRYAGHSADKTRPYEGVLTLLDGLRERGIAAAVLSNKPDAFTRALCGRYFPGRLAACVGHREGYPHKPDPSLMAEILERLRVPAGDCAYAGDSGVDMQTGKNAGAFTVGVLWGFRDRAELLENGADALAGSPLELLRLIEEKNLEKTS